MDVCRACLSENRPTVPLFAISEATSPVKIPLSKLFTSCTSIKVTKQDGLPQQLCFKCLAPIKQWFFFRYACIQSNNNLQKAALNNVTVSSHTSKQPDKQHVTETCDPSAIDETSQTNATQLSSTMIVVLDNDIEDEQEKCIEFYVDETKSELKSTILESHVLKEVENVIALDTSYAVNQEHTYAYVREPDQIAEIKYYHCRWCNKIFTNLDEYRAHASDVHADQCECGNDSQLFYLDDLVVQQPNNISITSKSEDLIENKEVIELKKQNIRKKGTTDSHPAKNQRRKRKPVKCPNCPKICSSSWGYKVHRLVHTGEKPHLCDVCGRRFSQIGHLKTHSFTHSGEKNYICEICSKKFVTVSLLNQHMQVHYEDLKRHSCTTCSKKFFLPSQLAAHMRIHTKECPFECSICLKSFRLKAKLKEHLTRHGVYKLLQPKYFKESTTTGCKTDEQNAEKLICEVCQKEYSTKNALKVHSLRHGSTRPFSCTICNRNFKEEATLTAHIKFHKRPKPFECETCHKRFIDRSALRVHHRTHTGEKPFSCEVCNKKFTVKRSLDVHMSSHTGERPFGCTVCDATFRVRCSLQTHMMNQHNCEP